MIFYTAPQKQWIVLQDGIIEIETSLDVKRIFFNSTELLVKDTEGRSHKTKNVPNTKRKSLFITLP